MSGLTEVVDFSVSRISEKKNKFRPRPLKFFISTDDSSTKYSTNFKQSQDSRPVELPKLLCHWTKELYKVEILLYRRTLVLYYERNLDGLGFRSGAPYLTRLASIFKNPNNFMFYKSGLCIPGP